MKPVLIIGGGLAGSEAAWQIARRGVPVRLCEMRPARTTPAHKTSQLAEIVCSNSFKSNQPGTAPWLLKEELKALDSLLLKLAYRHRVPSGASLSVDRERFAAAVTEALAVCPGVEIVREEVLDLPAEGPAIVATGPLTSPALSQSLRAFMGEEHLYFYDAISPIVETDSIDAHKTWRGVPIRQGRSRLHQLPA